MLGLFKGLGLFVWGVLELLWELVTINPDKGFGRETSIATQDLAALEPMEVDPHGTIVCAPESPDADDPPADRYTGFAVFVPPSPVSTIITPTDFSLVETVVIGLLVLPKTIWEHLHTEERASLDDYPTVVGMLPEDVQFIESEAERLAAESAATHRRVEQQIAAVHRHTEESTV